MQRQKPDGVLYYGGRKSDKFVRCYKKGALTVFRVEVELHSKLLRDHSVSELDDFRLLPDVVYPKHLLFVEIDWGRLEQYLDQTVWYAGLSNTRRGTEAGCLIATGAALSDQAGSCEHPSFSGSFSHK